jgi:DNA uptake protein ComE-like DNA-binding protein
MNQQKTRSVLLGFIICVVQFAGTGRADELIKLTNCTLVKTDWADGDSFRVKDEDGKEYTFRLYCVDCLESHVNDTTDARRLRAQRRYFGIARHGGSAATSIAAAKDVGKKAKTVVERELQKPFTVHTSFADGRGDANYKRYYAFITTNAGKDLGEQLVRLGLARAFGVYRKTPSGRPHDEQRSWLRDIELQAAARNAGVWALTDWDSLPAERQKEREEAAELALAVQGQPLDAENKINLNLAARDDLMRLPGIGEVMANRIIERRPYKSIEALLDVSGIGDKSLAQIRPYVKLSD